MNEEMELTAEEIAKNFGLESNDDFMKALSELINWWQEVKHGIFL